MTVIGRTDQTARLRALCVEAGIRVSLAGYIRENDLARLLDVSTRTVRAWRYDGSGPAATRIGGGYWYRLGELATYLARPSAEESGRTGIVPSGECAEDGVGNHPRHRTAQR